MHVTLKIPQIHPTHRSIATQKTVRKKKHKEYFHKFNIAPLWLKNDVVVVRQSLQS